MDHHHRHQPRPPPPRSTSTSETTTTPTTPTAPNPFFVVAHVPLADLVDETGDKSELAGELEHHGLIDVETVQRIACDATVVVAVDDKLGHTMYEGRARRFPTGAQRREVIRRDRQCRFPGCANVTFAAVHHVKPWDSGGRTDLENLVLVCKKHHGMVHRKGWSMTGNPNRSSPSRSDRPGHGVAPFGALDQGDSCSQQGAGGESGESGGARAGELSRRVLSPGHPCATLIG